MTTTDNELEKLDTFDQEVADAIEPYLSWEYNVRVGRTDWAEEGLKSVSVGEGHELYQAVKALKDKAHTLGKKEGRREGFEAARMVQVDVSESDGEELRIGEEVYHTLADYEKELEKE